ncbi:hypothetical protein PILCRDRAFT_13258 [Piloderma croceum F 1598]|uniref:Uncharacterized protein n=1 Tax=Piloderma croceum (strain F 1598) TaxID=765440 RepID=A0A0C3ETN3_PILCF|nr:hypothetical protein PILCRDRAFT_13258 [Piloderma croceum F 1598]
MTFGLSKRGQQYRAEAGEIHGVVTSTLFTIHTLANATAINSEFGILEAVDIFADSCILQNINTTQFKILARARVLVLNWKQKEKDLKVFMEPPHDEVQPIEDTFSLVDDSECADLVIHRTGQGTLQFERLDLLMSTYAPVLGGISSKPGLSAILHGVSNFNFHISRRNSINPLKQYVKVTLHHLIQSNYDLDLEEPMYIPQGLVDQPLILSHINEVVASSKATTDVDYLFYGLTVTNESPHDLFPYLFYFDPSDYSIQPLYHLPCLTMEAPLASASATTKLPVLKVGCGEANVEAIRFTADDKSDNIGFVKLFVSSTYVDMTGLQQDPIFYGAHVPRGGAAMVKLPGKDVWDT